MSDQKHANTDDPLARLVAIEAPEFLDRLVLEQARALLTAAAASRAELPRAEARPQPGERTLAPIEAILARLTLARSRSW